MSDLLKKTVLGFLLNSITENCASVDNGTAVNYKRQKHKKHTFVLSSLVAYRRKGARRRVIPKNTNYIEVIHTFPDDVFHSHFRMSPQCFLKLLEEVKSKRPVFRRGRCAVDPETALYVTLWVLSNQNSLREVSDRFNLSIGLVYNFVIKNCKIITSMAAKYISWPTEEEFHSIVDGFNNIRQPIGFPSVAGCLDATHIKIACPTNDGYSYYNRKGYHSMILQGICDHRLLFRDIYFGWPGGSHDANVWHNSPVGNSLDNGALTLPNDSHLLGDSAYPLRPYLITPFRDNGFLSSNQRKFNYIHSSTRVCIEQAFGILKSKFRCLNHLHVRKLSNAKFIVMSCVVLHNFIRMNSADLGIFVLDIREVNSTISEDNEPIESNNQEMQSAIIKREVLCEWLCA